MASLRKNAVKDKAKELRQRIDDSLNTLAKAVDEVRTSETFRRYLDVQAQFHKYSWHNCLLILSQRPDASQVAGYRTWQKLGRQVPQGERGLMIFAPCPFKREVERDDGETEERDGIYFKPVHVFDVAQTDGEDLPSVDLPTVDVAADRRLARRPQARCGPINQTLPVPDTLHLRGNQNRPHWRDIKHPTLREELSGPGRGTTVSA